MSDQDSIAAFFGAQALFRGLSATDIVEVAQIAEPFTLAAGQTLFRQGQSSDGIFFIRDGAIEICARVPGDEVVTLVRLGAGDALGEVALLDRGARSATALGLERTTGYWISRRSFDLLRLARSPASTAIMRRLTEMTCNSLRRSYARIADLLGGGAKTLATATQTNNTFDEVEGRDYPFTVLPFFAQLSRRDVDAVVSAGRILGVERGDQLYRQGAKSNEAFVVMRGALRSVLEAGGKKHQIAVYAPGSADVALSTLDALPNDVSLEACETSHVLALGQDALGGLSATNGQLASCVGDAVYEHLVKALRQATEHASRIELERLLGAGAAR